MNQSDWLIGAPVDLCGQTTECTNTTLVGEPMHKFNWDSHLETGNELIDREHKEIVGIYNDCVDSVQRGTELKKLITRLNELHAKLAAHFKTEEILAGCISANTEGELKIARHKEQHDEMLGYMQATISKLADSGDSTVVVAELLDRLYEWYEIHIEHEDKDFVAHIKKRFAS